MFSANENILLREHKKRIVKYVEETIPEEIQEMGTMVMVMQLTCQAPGCVPLETAVIVVFPPSPHELLPGLPQSKSGGEMDGTTTASSSSSSTSNNGSNFQTKILKPMAEVTREDVLDALPPAFTGGRRTMEALCVRARDVMLAQITQIMGTDDKDGRQLMAEYLMDCLQEYLRRDCTPPEYGQPYPPVSQEDEKEEQLDATSTMVTSTPAIPASSDSTTTTQESNKNNTVVTTIPGTSNLVIRRVLDNENTDKNNNNKTAAAGAPQAPAISSLANATSTTTTTTNSTHLFNTSTLSKPTTTTATTTTATTATATPSQMDWRNRQRQQNLFSSSGTSAGGSIVARLSEREHAPGVRRPGCPCCDPDNISNILIK